MKETVYICTIGTGTAGATSSLAQGVVNAVRLRSPQFCVLVPSISENSVLVADMVETELSNDKVISLQRPASLSDPDDLRQCRREMRELIRQLKALHSTAKLILNPTSGTKQMTTGAVLAGIDEGLEHIEYITGPRKDGVVVTGQERITAISGRHILAEKTLRNAQELMLAGAYNGAVQLLKSYGDVYPRSLALARTLFHWDRFAYDQALASAEACNASLDETRKTLTRLYKAKRISLPRAADMLALVDRRLTSGEAEEALAVLYRCVEMLAKLRLYELGVSPERATLAQLRETIHPPKRLDEQLVSMSRNNDQLHLGLRLCLDLLDSTGCSFARTILSDKAMWNTLQKRNDTRYGHGTDQVDPKKIRQLLHHVQHGAGRQWPNLLDSIRCCHFPAIETILEEELDHV
jgi:TolA-binding protein